MCTILIRVEQLEEQLIAAGVIVVQVASKLLNSVTNREREKKKQQHTHTTYNPNVHE